MTSNRRRGKRTPLPRSTELDKHSSARQTGGEVSFTPAGLARTYRRRNERSRGSLYGFAYRRRRAWRSAARRAAQPSLRQVLLARYDAEAGARDAHRHRSRPGHLPAAGWQREGDAADAVVPEPRPRKRKERRGGGRLECAGLRPRVCLAAPLDLVPVGAEGGLPGDERRPVDDRPAAVGGEEAAVRAQARDVRSAGRGDDRLTDLPERGNAACSAGVLRELRVDVLDRVRVGDPRPHADADDRPVVAVVGPAVVPEVDSRRGPRRPPS